MIKILLSVVTLSYLAAFKLEPPKIYTTERPPIKVPANFILKTTRYDYNYTRTDIVLTGTLHVDSKGNRAAIYIENDGIQATDYQSYNTWNTIR